MTAADRSYRVDRDQQGQTERERHESDTDVNSEVVRRERGGSDAAEDEDERADGLGREDARMSQGPPPGEPARSPCSEKR